MTLGQCNLGPWPHCYIACWGIVLEALDNNRHTPAGNSILCRPCYALQGQTWDLNDTITADEYTCLQPALDGF